MHGYQPSRRRFFSRLASTGAAFWLAASGRDSFSGETLEENAQPSMQKEVLLGSQHIVQLPTLPGRLDAASFSPDGKKLAVVCTDPQRSFSSVLYAIDVRPEGQYRKLAEFPVAEKVYSVSWNRAGLLAVAVFETSSAANSFQLGIRFFDSDSGKSADTIGLLSLRTPMRSSISLFATWMDEHRLLGVMKSSPSLYEIDTRPKASAKLVPFYTPESDERYSWARPCLVEDGSMKVLRWVHSPPVPRELPSLRTADELKKYTPSIDDKGRQFSIVRVDASLKVETVVRNKTAPSAFVTSVMPVRNFLVIVSTRPLGATTEDASAAANAPLAYILDPDRNHLHPLTNTAIDPGVVADAPFQVVSTPARSIDGNRLALYTTGRPPWSQSTDGKSLAVIDISDILI